MNYPAAGECAKQDGIDCLNFNLLNPMPMRSDIPRRTSFEMTQTTNVRLNLFEVGAFMDTLNGGKTRYEAF